MPGRSEVTLSSDGRDRASVLYVPEGLIPSEPVPLVVDFTAYSPASLQESFSGFTRPDAGGAVKADEVGAIVVTPEPVNGKGLLTWNIDGTDGWTDDQQFVSDLIDHVAADACIDTRRILAMGFAIGGAMASRLACEQPELITVLATVSGLWDPAGCEPSEAVPVISFHGTDDHFLPYEGGVGDRVTMLGLTAETTAGLVAMSRRPEAPDASAAWAERNGCDDRVLTEPVNGKAGLQRWTGCEADVELYVIENAGHTWPGSNGMASYEGLLGPVSQDIVANDLIWEFFEARTQA